MSMLANVFRPRTGKGSVRSLENPNIPVSPVQLDAIWGYGPTRAGVQINERTALTFTAVFCAVNILAESIGYLPLQPLRRVDDETSEPAFKHPSWNLLTRSASAEQTAVAFKQTVQANLALWGRGYARIRYNNAGEAIELIPLPSDRTYPERKAGELIYSVDGKAGTAGSKTETYYPEEIIAIPGLSLDGLQCLTPIGFCREAIATGKAAEMFAGAFFGNGSMPIGALKAKGKLSDKAYQRLREDWINTQGGPGNAWRPAILEEGLEWQELGMPMEDAQFLQLRQFQVVEVARIFRVPPHMLMDLTRSTNNNIEQQALEFLTWTMAPWLAKWEQEVTRKLFANEPDMFVRFDIKQLMRADLNNLQAFVASMRQWGAWSANDVRRFLDQNGIGKTGDIYLSPGNMLPADELGQNPPPGSTPAPTPPKKNEDETPARAFRGLFEDAAGRCVRKEAKATEKASAKEAAAFYASHGDFVRSVLMPPAAAYAELRGLDFERAKAAVDAAATKRGAKTEELAAILLAM